MRLIDADALITYCNNLRDKLIDANEIARFPTIEAEPVRRGKWLPHPTEKDWRVCSACRQGTEIVRHEAGATTEYNYKHCPWCGVRMENDD